jgi:hypothetical protein
MGRDRDGEEFFDAVGKRRTAKECGCKSDKLEKAANRKVSLASEQTARHGSGQSVEQSADEHFVRLNRE